jgi:hypothetical protein
VIFRQSAGAEVKADLMDPVGGDDAEVVSGRLGVGLSFFDARVRSPRRRPRSFSQRPRAHAIPTVPQLYPQAQRLETDPREKVPAPNLRTDVNSFVMRGAKGKHEPQRNAGDYPCVARLGKAYRAARL